MVWLQTCLGHWKVEDMTVPCWQDLACYLCCSNILYGDPAYPLRPRLQGPFKGAHITRIQQQWNKAMSATRVSVEWIFGDIVNYLKFLDCRKNLKIKLSAVGKMYIVCALLQNARSCCYGSTTASIFAYLTFMTILYERTPIITILFVDTRCCFISNKSKGNNYLFDNDYFLRVISCFVEIFTVFCLSLCYIFCSSDASCISANIETRLNFEILLYHTILAGILSFFSASLNIISSR